MTTNTFEQRWATFPEEKTVVRQVKPHCGEILPDEIAPLLTSLGFSVVEGASNNDGVTVLNINKSKIGVLLRIQFSFEAVAYRIIVKSTNADTAVDFANVLS